MDEAAAVEEDAAAAIAAMLKRTKMRESIVAVRFGDECN